MDMQQLRLIIVAKTFDLYTKAKASCSKRLLIVEGLLL
jgi:hypothetical protein